MHPRSQGYPVFLNVTSRIFPLIKWIGGSGDEDGANDARNYAQKGCAMQFNGFTLNDCDDATLDQ